MAALIAKTGLKAGIAARPVQGKVCVDGRCGGVGEGSGAPPEGRPSSARARPALPAPMAAAAAAVRGSSARHPPTTAAAPWAIRARQTGLPGTNPLSPSAHPHKPPAHTHDSA